MTDSNTDISQLKFDTKNFNRHTKRGMEMLQTSVSNNGFGRSVLVDKDNNIIAGNGIVETAQKLGKNSIRVIETDGNELVVVKRTDLTLDSKEGREMALADNASAAVDLDWDEDNLREMHEAFDIDFESYGLEFPDFDDDTSDAATAADAEDDGYDTTPPSEPKSLPGDIWVLGKHRVICGDSTLPETVTKLMQGETARMLLTDPPYNVDYVGSHSDKYEQRERIANDNMPAEDFVSFLTAAFSSAHPHIDAGCPCYIWYALANHAQFVDAFLAADFKISEYLIWVKNTFTLGRCDYHYRHEPCIYGWKKGAPHVWYGGHTHSTVLEFDKPQRSAEHPTMKPIPLFAFQMENSTRAGDIVLDIFGGSGTTLIAAEQLGRCARLVEFSPQYVDVIVNRYATLVGNTKEIYLLRDGERLSYDEVMREDN